MSEENVAVVRAMNDAYVRGDVEQAVGYFDPAIEWRGTVGGLDENDVFTGTEEIVAGLSESVATWERLTFDYERYLDAGDQVVAFVHEVARGKDGLELTNDTAIVYTVANGRVTHVRGYMDREAALAAAGVGSA